MRRVRRTAQRGGEEHRLPLLGQVRDDGRDVGGEAQLEQPVHMRTYACTCTAGRQAGGQAGRRTRSGSSGLVGGLLLLQAGGGWAGRAGGRVGAPVGLVNDEHA